MCIVGESGGCMCPAVRLHLRVQNKTADRALISDESTALKPILLGPLNLPHTGDRLQPRVGLRVDGRPPTHGDEGGRRRCGSGQGVKSEQDLAHRQTKT